MYHNISHIDNLSLKYISLFSITFVVYFEIKLCLGTVQFDWKEDANLDDKDHGIFNDTNQPWGPVGVMFK